MAQLEISGRMPRGLTAVSARRIARRLATVLPPKGNVGIAIVGDSDARRLNQRYRGKNRVPDVLSFLLNAEGSIGEVILARERLLAQAREYAWPVPFEFARLTLHGFLHLAGAHHVRREQRIRMECRERRILTQLFPTLRTHPTVQQWLTGY